MPADRGRHVRAGRLGREPLGARRRARHGPRAAPAIRRAGCRFAVSDETHSSVRNTMHIIDVDPLVVPAGRRPPHRRRARRRARRRRRSRRRCARSSRPRARTNAGLVDDLAGIAAVCARTRALDARRRGVRRRRAARAERARPRSPASSTPTRSSSTRTSGCTRRSTARRCSIAIPRFARSVHSQHASYLDVDPRRGHGVEPVRLRVPPHPARPRSAVLVLARGERHRRVPRRGRTRARDGTRRRRSHPRAPPPRARARARALGRAVPAHRLGRGRLRRVVGPAASTTRSRSSPRRAGTTRPSPGSRSCTPRPRSTIVDEILATTA